MNVSFLTEASSFSVIMSLWRVYITMGASFSFSFKVMLTPSRKYLGWKQPYSVFWIFFFIADPALPYHSKTKHKCYSFLSFPICCCNHCDPVPILLNYPFCVAVGSFVMMAIIKDITATEALIYSWKYHFLTLFYLKYLHYLSRGVSWWRERQRHLQKGDSECWH